MFTIYLIGVLVTAIYLIVWEYFVDHDKDLRNVTKVEWIQDSIVAFTSWLGFVICILVTIYKLCGGQKA